MTEFDQASPLGQQESRRDFLRRVRNASLFAAAVTVATQLDACGLTPGSSSSSEIQPFAPNKPYTGYFSTGEANNSNLLVALTLDETTEILSTPDGDPKDTTVPFSAIQTIAGTNMLPQKRTTLQITGEKIGYVTRDFGSLAGYDSNGKPIFTDDKRYFIEVPLPVTTNGEKKYVYIPFERTSPPVTVIKKGEPNGLSQSPSMISLEAGSSTNQSSGINQNLQATWL